MSCAVTKTQRVPVTERALIARINRALRPDRALKIAHPGSHLEQKVGRFYLLQGNRLARAHIDLVSFARELDCISDFEELADV